MEMSNSEIFLNDFINSVIVDEFFSQKTAVVSYFKEISNKPEYDWLRKLHDERLVEINKINASDPEFKTASDKIHESMGFDPLVEAYAIRSLRVEIFRKRMQERMSQTNNVKNVFEQESSTPRM